MSIKKIAEMTGVSISTVSRVLNKPEYKCSSLATREKIFAAARELNYVPNESAKNLRRGKKDLSETYRLTILVTRTDSNETDPFFSELISMIRFEINKHMCILSNIIYRSEFSNEMKCSSMDLKSEIKNLKKNDISDGMIIVGKCCPQVIKHLKSAWKNIISVNRNSTEYNIDEVICDGRKIAETAIEYLIKLGHRKIAYVGECHNESRFKGYQETLIRYNVESDIDYIIQTDLSESDGYDAMERIIKMTERPTGIYCTNDIIAIGMLKCLNKYGNRYYKPSVISSDDIAEARYTKPMLTTISLPKEEMAKFAISLLIDRIKNEHNSVVKMELQGELIIRTSCFPMSEYDPIEYYI